MTDRAEATKSVARQFTSVGNIVRLSAAAVVLAMNIGDHSGWRSLASSIGVTVIAGDWILQAIRNRKMLFAAMGVYSLFAAIGSLLYHNAHPSTAVLWVIAALTAAAGAVALVIAATAGLRGKELDRLIFSDASSIAFFATMLVAITYGLLDSWLKVPELSIWVLVGVGGGTWAVVFVGLQQKYS